MKFAIKLLVAGVLVTRIAYVLYLGEKPPGWDDEREHDRIGWNLACTGRYESSAYRAAPLGPVFLAGVYRVFGHSYFAARFFQSVIGSALLALAITGIGSRLWGQRIGVLAGALTAVYPPLWDMSGVFYAEFMLAVLLAAFVYCLVRWHQTQGWWWLGSGGLLLGTAVLCRPIALSVLPVALSYVGWGAISGRRLWKAACFLAAVAAVVFPWTVRNAIVFRRFVLVASGSGLHLWRGNNEVAKGDADDRHLWPNDAFWLERVQALGPHQRAAALRHMKSLSAQLETLDEVRWDRRLGEEGLRWLLANPARFVALGARRLMTLYSAFTKTKNDKELVGAHIKLIAAASFYPLLGLGLIGWVLSWRRQRASWIVHGVIAAVTLAYLPMTTCTRFRLPLDGFWILLASVAVVEIANRFRKGLVPTVAE